ncbi:MAG: hypothetical protein N2318_11660 [Meiothermus sp.]|nr:hypothetical protein [Meiothermus sp.]
MKQTLGRLALLALMLATLVACGGGGGSNAGIWDNSQWDQANWQ